MEVLLFLTLLGKKKNIYKHDMQVEHSVKLICVFVSQYLCIHPLAHICPFYRSTGTRVGERAIVREIKKRMWARVVLQDV